MEKPFFDKKISAYLKGIMLILMVILHFFCFPEWYIEGITYPGLQFMSQMQGHFQICIAGFAFLTGYFYAFAKKKTYRYSLRKMVEILIPYWLVYIVFLLLAVLTKTANLSVRAIILEICALEFHVMSFCWYVSFYLLSLLCLPTLILICREHRLLFIGLGIFGPIALYYTAAHFVKAHWAIALLEKFQVYFPIITVGYATASYRVFEKIDALITRFDRKTLLKPILSLLLIGIVFAEPGWLYQIPLDGFVFSVFRKLFRIVSIPAFMYGLISLLVLAKGTVFLLPLKLIGDYSLLMWFAHGLFFGCSKEVFQPWLFWPGNPLLVILWGLLLNLIFALFFNMISGRLIALVNRNKGIINGS